MSEKTWAVSPCALTSSIVAVRVVGWEDLVMVGTARAAMPERVLISAFCATSEIDARGFVKVFGGLGDCCAIAVDNGTMERST